MISWRTTVRRSMSELGRGWPDGPVSDSVQGPAGLPMAKPVACDWPSPWGGNVKRATILVPVG